jgi:hypothetical protein
LNVTLRAHRFLGIKVPSGYTKELGTELDLLISYKMRKGMSLITGFSKFYTGRFFEQASGGKKDIDYAYIQAEVEF